MIDRITYIESKETSPYHNLALEEHLLLHCGRQECILYLWQNRHTIVIGKNQNAWKECRVSRFEEEGGRLARRLSGGGAVYHDLGNLNFTFLVRKENYDVEKQTEVILRAVRKLGILAERSGRNDLLCGGRKFSGNAYYRQGDFCYHHGTLMVEVDVESLTRYLTVSPEKLKAKGVESVRSRVMNLKESMPEITVEQLKEKLLEAFEEVYGLQAGRQKIEKRGWEDIEERRRKFASWDWIFGSRIDFQHEISRKFCWGQVVLCMCVISGWIREVRVYSDSMRPDYIEGVESCLAGVRYSREELLKALEGCPSEDGETRKMTADMASWIKEIEW